LKKELSDSLEIDIVSSERDITKHEKKIKWQKILATLSLVGVGLAFLFSNALYLFAGVILLIVSLSWIWGQYKYNRNWVSNYQKYLKEDNLALKNCEKDLVDVNSEILEVETKIKEYNDFVKKAEDGYKMNIDEFTIGDSFHKGRYTISDKSKNSVEVLIKKNDKFYSTEYVCDDCDKVTILDKKTKKFKCSNHKCVSTVSKSETKIYSGIDHKQWLTMNDFNKLLK